MLWFRVCLLRSAAATGACYIVAFVNTCRCDAIIVYTRQAKRHASFTGCDSRNVNSCSCSYARGSISMLELAHILYVAACVAAEQREGMEWLAEKSN